MQLKAGDLLSYSSGRQDHGPHGFRVVRKGAGILGVLSRYWPDVLAPLAGKVPLVLNAYPATLGGLDFGVFVDSYLSQGTASRAIQLATLEKMPLMILGQSCFVADLITRHIERYKALPEAVIVGTGGHVMPRSLELYVRGLVAPYTKSFSIVHGYGVAEVDSSCLLAVTRDESGVLVYRPREDVRVTLDGEKLLLTLLDGAGKPIHERYDGGDSGKELPGGGYHIYNNERLHPNVAKILESWSPEDWARRTGYLYFGREVRFQLRKGVDPKMAIECEFYDYMKRYGQSWLFKPEWHRAKDGDSADPLRRTILLSNEGDRLFMDYEIRDAKATDVEQIYDIWREGLTQSLGTPFHESDDHRRDFERIVKEQTDDFKVFVAETPDGKILGWQTLVPFRANPAVRGLMAELSAYTRKEHMKQNVARDLLFHAIRHADSSKLQYVVCYVAKTNERALSIVQRAGFILVGTLPPMVREPRGPDLALLAYAAGNWRLDD